jgi:RND family efflux transporter MFP subunit
MRKLTWGLAAALVTLPLAWLGRGAATSVSDAPDGAKVARVARRDLQAAVRATGVIKPRIGAEVRVGSRASGVVKRLYVRVGDGVQKGQLLAELDDRELAAQRDQAVAALDSARARLAFARTDARRKRALSRSSLVAQVDVDLAEQAFAVAEQERAEAEARLAFAKAQLGYARIRAPISGVVGSVSTQEGETVSASLTAPTFLTLLDLDRLEVQAYVDETDIGRIVVEQPATFTVDTYPDHKFEGRVTAIYPQPAIRDNVVNYITVVDFEPPGGYTLRPEMTAAVQITIENHRGVLVVPRGAVRRDQGRRFVRCLRGAEVVERAVTTGAHDDRYWEIVEGLMEGETVLIGRGGAGL